MCVCVCVCMSSLSFLSQSVVTYILPCAGFADMVTGLMGSTPHGNCLRDLTWPTSRVTGQVILTLSRATGGTRHLLTISVCVCVCVCDRALA